MIIMSKYFHGRQKIRTFSPFYNICYKNKEIMKIYCENKYNIYIYHCQSSQIKLFQWIHC